MEIDELLQGSIDMHLHTKPSPTPYRLDALETARLAQEAGMRAIVFKSHYYPTEPIASLVRQLVPGVAVFGSVCLDFEVGGLNYHAVESSAKLGARVVWMPTFSSANSRAKIRKVLGFPLEGEGFSIVNDKGKLVPEMDRILSLVKEYNLVLATGHISPRETFALVEEARRRGIWKLVITHAFDTELVDNAFTMEDQQRLAQMGAFIEYSYHGLLAASFGHNPVHMVEAIRSVGAEHFIISTDFGPSYTPLPTEGMRSFIATLLRKGLTAQEVEFMAKVNPAKLLDLD